jgi:hypothetical protein
MRRIRTEDVTPIWFATLAVRLCRDIGNQTGAAHAELALLARGAANLALGGGRAFDLPLSKQDWLGLYQEVYVRWNGALNNRTGGTSEQYDSEAALNEAALKTVDGPGLDLLFGRS